MVAIQVSEERGVRSLHFGSPWVQGAMRVSRPYVLELEYTRDLMLPLLLRDDDAWPKSVLQVGLGAASITRFLWKHRPAAKLRVVEMAPEVVAAARQFFKLPDDPRVAIDIAEGHAWLATHRGKYDLVVVDGFDERGRAGMLDSVPFYLNAAQRLAANGMLSVNLLTRRKSASPSIERLRAAFGERVLELPASEAGNVAAIAAVGRPVSFSRDGLREAEARLRKATGLDLRSTVARLLACHRQVEL